MKQEHVGHNNRIRDAEMLDDENIDSSLRTYLNRSGNNKNILEDLTMPEPPAKKDHISMGEMHAKQKQPAKGIHCRRRRKP